MFRYRCELEYWRRSKQGSMKRSRTRNNPLLVTHSFFDYPFVSLMTITFDLQACRTQKFAHCYMND